jgi:hypothetical protein
VRSIEVADQARRIAPGWIDECIQLQPVHRL